MKKQKPLLILLSAVLLSSLSSCYFFNIDYRWTKDDNNISTQKATDHVEYGTPTYSSAFSKDNLNKDTIGAGYGYHYLPSTGNSKILVIPIETSDYSFTNSDITMIQNSFFGDSSDTGWESVASFYEKSSYNRLHLSGEVTTPIKFNRTAAQLEQTAATYTKNNENYTDVILKSAVKTLKDKTNIDFSDYDTDKDGYIDAVWMVYAVPYSTNSDFYWAFTTWASISEKFNGVSPCCYAWASVSFLTEMDYRPNMLASYTNYGDAHTFIHETGHMMGLDDYYSYDMNYSSTTRSGNTDTPVGGVDMMDFNIGDHDSFSKYLLGWITPTVVTPELLSNNDNTLTLTSLTNTGSAYLIPIYKNGEADYNCTAFDEYLMVEYYTPSNLNSKDVNGYNSRLATYSEPGVLVYHVDARVGKVTAVSNTEAKWDGKAYDMLPAFGSDRNWGYSYLYAYIYSNTKSYSWDKSLVDTNLAYYRGRLISLLPATGYKTTGDGNYSSNRVLYRNGRSFNSSLYKDFMFDDGSTPKYGFTISAVSSSDCTLKFTDF